MLLAVKNKKIFFLSQEYLQKQKVGFKQDVRKWYTKMNAAETLAYENRKFHIKAVFKERGFPICEPRDGGKGSSNDGMTDYIF